MIRTIYENLFTSRADLLAIELAECQAKNKRLTEAIKSLKDTTLDLVGNVQGQSKLIEQQQEIINEQQIKIQHQTAKIQELTLANHHTKPQ